MWAENLRRSVLREFVDAARLKGAHEPGEARVWKVGPPEPAKEPEVLARRRIVQPRKAAA
jgi:hypothetical protein